MADLMSGYAYQIVLILLLALASWLGAQIKRMYNKYVTTEDKYITTAIMQAVCKTAVRFVEQVYKDIHGAEKLKAAMAKAEELLKEKGIAITETELIAMLEAAVNEFNNSFARS